MATSIPKIKDQNVKKQADVISKTSLYCVAEISTEAGMLIS